MLSIKENKDGTFTIDGLTFNNFIQIMTVDIIDKESLSKLMEQPQLTKRLSGKDAKEFANQYQKFLAERFEKFLPGYKYPETAELEQITNTKSYKYIGNKPLEDMIQDVKGENPKIDIKDLYKAEEEC